VRAGSTGSTESRPRLLPSGLPHSSDVPCLPRTFTAQYGESDFGKSCRRKSLVWRRRRWGRRARARYVSLLAASPCFPSFRARGGEAEHDPEGSFSAADLLEESWSGRRDSNPRPRPWQGRALPLSYARAPIRPGRCRKPALIGLFQALCKRRKPQIISPLGPKGAVRRDLVSTTSRFSSREGPSTSLGTTGGDA
jgi:hypothetical protein